MSERFNRTPVARGLARNMMRVNPRYVDIAHAEMVRIYNLLKADNWLMDVTPRIVVNRKPQLACAVFERPNFIAMNFMQIQSEAQLLTDMRASMASFALSAQFALHMRAYNQLLSARGQVKPQLPMVGSEQWQNLIARFVETN